MSISSLENIPNISFIDDLSLNELKIQMENNFIDEYKKLTQKSFTLSDANPFKLILNACAMQIYQAFQYIDRAGKQNLLKYSYGEFLDNLAALRGITRNSAKPASTTLQFKISDIRESITTIPKGTRVAAEENIYFETTEDAQIPTGAKSIEVNAKCLVNGDIGNNYKIGDINIIVDPLPYIASVSNITVSSGGNNIESDKNLAERIYLAPSSYSVAGPADAYIYWIKSFNSEIGDVKIISPNPGEIFICFLMSNGNLPNENILNELAFFLQTANVKPLSDKISVSAPKIQDYEINLTYYINKSDSAQSLVIQNAVDNAISEFEIWQRKIGRDINPSELTKQILNAGAKRVVITQPEFIHIDELNVAVLSHKKILYGGLEDD